MSLSNWLPGESEYKHIAIRAIEVLCRHDLKWVRCQVHNEDRQVRTTRSFPSIRCVFRTKTKIFGISLKLYMKSISSVHTAGRISIRNHTASHISSQIDYKADCGVMMTR
jgi:hypothetical protein